VSHHFFETVGIPLIQGRNFTTTDSEKAPAVAIVNQTFVRQFLKDKNPIGQYFGYDAANDHRFQIVGVVRDARVNDVRESAPPMIYHSIEQDVIDAEALDIRTFADPSQLILQVIRAVRSVDPNLPIGGIATLAEQVSSNLAQQRLIARLTTIFGVLALGLACLGLYGVMSYTVAQRTSELGIRLALGSTRWKMLCLVLQESLMVIGAGILVGVGLSLAGTRLVSSMLFGLSPHDPVTLAAAAVMLLLVSIAAGLLPAWRAAHVDTVVALRHE